MSTIAEIEPRTYFSSLDNALADFAPPYEAIDRIREVARELRYTHVYIPENRAHIGLEPDDGGAAIAYIFPTMIALHPRDGVSSFVELPQPAVEADDAQAGSVSAPAVASGRAATSGRVAAPGRAAAPGQAMAEPAACGRCFVTLPATGRCDTCD